MIQIKKGASTVQFEPIYIPGSELVKSLLAIDPSKPDLAFQAVQNPATRPIAASIYLITSGLTSIDQSQISAPVIKYGERTINELYKRLMEQLDQYNTTFN